MTKKERWNVFVNISIMVLVFIAMYLWIGFIQGRFMPRNSCRI